MKNLTIKLMVVCGIATFTSNTIAASDPHILKYARTILESYFDKRWHSEERVEYNNCKNDDNFGITDTDAKINDFKIVELEGVGDLSSGIIKFEVKCVIETINGACVGGIGDGGIKPIIGKPTKQLSMNYVFQDKKFISLGILTDDAVPPRGNIPKALKPTEYIGCGAETINGRKQAILDDSIVVLP